MHSRLKTTHLLNSLVAAIVDDRIDMSLQRTLQPRTECTSWTRRSTMYTPTYVPFIREKIVVLLITLAQMYSPLWLFNGTICSYTTCNCASHLPLPSLFYSIPFQLYRVVVNHAEFFQSRRLHCINTTSHFYITKFPYD
jgi:hypothetical protein